MKTYLVKWEIGVDAESPKEAAEEAHRIQLDKESLATVFTVEDSEASTTYHVDLHRLLDYADDDILYVVLRNDVAAVAEAYDLPPVTPEQVRSCRKGIEAYFGEVLEEVILTCLQD